MQPCRQIIDVISHILAYTKRLKYTVSCSSFANWHIKHKNLGSMVNRHLGSVEEVQFLRMNRFKSKWKDISKEYTTDIWLMMSMHPYFFPSHDNDNANHNLRWREGHLLWRSKWMITSRMACQQSSRSLNVNFFTWITAIC